ncbi:PilC/PilY family type IV pilus protein [Piscinibacter sp. XHJ-5]|uniref:pilus assembly protein n=1 Tax=Piscinibacter sp. XHJ-5 TaxID=3037797 RepID=UPI002452EB64|nr:PilC/PilY family type IV pilus protein [Piscinibacter sp. XHJ-5]
MNTIQSTPKVWRAAALIGAIAAAVTAHAATTDIATAPLVTSAPSSVLSNLMFILDDSGSMSSDFMPDWAADQHCRSAGATSSNSGSFALQCRRTSGGNLYGQPLHRSSAFNSIYYNPAIRYLPPSHGTGGTGDLYPSQTSANTAGWTSVRDDAYGIQSTTSTNLVSGFYDLAWCTDTSYGDCLRNGNYVLPGTVNNKNYTVEHYVTATGTGSIAVGAPDAPTTQTRSFGPHYYSIVAGEYCTSITLRNCQATQSATYNIPASLRWCDTDANARAAVPAANSCQAQQTSTYSRARFPTKFFTTGTAGTPATAEVRASTSFTMNVSGCSSGRKVAVQSLTVNGTNILSSATSLVNNRDNLGSEVASHVSGASGYTAVATNGGRTVTITAPAGVNANGYAVVLTATATSTCTFTPTNPSAFGGYTAAVAAQPAVPAGWYGSFVRTDIVPTTTSYPKTGSRSDCAGTTCTYDEEMTNFANWWTYYRTRMQMMKSSASLAFSGLSDQFRVAYMSINNSTGTDFHNFAKFEAAEKVNWFTKLQAARPNSTTPLRAALSTAGKLFAGKLTTVNGVAAADPVQYSCQKNFTILSTDGYWNESSTPTNLNGTQLGDQDSTLARPYLDGTATANTLADVAAYYYKTDLRDQATLNNCTGALGAGVDVCANAVPADSNDVATYQHMTTFTLGLGASGYMQFQSDYLTASSGDYFAVKNGLAADPANAVCSWQSSGDCNWPVPANNTQTAIDDLWHAAVNGHGTYFSATDPATLYSGLSAALSSINKRRGGAAAATTSNPNVSSGDNFIFSSNFMAQEWTGQLQRRQINLSTAAIEPTIDWSAQSQLDANTSRVIYTYDSSNASTHRKTFEWASLTTAEKAYFETTHMTSAGSLSQFCSFGTTCLSATAQSDAAGEKLVNFLRGDRTNEGGLADPSKYYRQRAHLLGDIVNSEAVYVKLPKFSYADTGYATYKASAAIQNRVAMVYVAANDGMLHAFDATTGAERWAYVPQAVLPKLYKLADKDYGNRHQYFVDGSPVVSDAFIGGQWRTVLVGSLGFGGRAYYALDVTDPTNPTVLWEFTHTNLGLTPGKAEITKLKTGQWVAIVASGYNNVSPGDGHGYLFVIDAATGALVGTPIDTGDGSAGTPSGLAHIRAWADHADIDNTAQRVYAGDLLGNVWRFDINGDIGAAGRDAQLLATLRGDAGNVQSVTARPELALVNGNAMVYVGTGRYLGTSDLSDSTQQSIYAIKDRLGTVSYGIPRSTTNNFVQQTLTDSTCPTGSTFCTPGRITRTGTNNAVDITTKDGWFVDLPASRERANTDPQLTLGTLVFTTNVLDPNACSAGGYGFFNFFDYRTGAPIAGTNDTVSQRVDSTLSSSNVGCLPNAVCKDHASRGDGEVETVNHPINKPSGSTRRTSWRELNTEQ